MVTMTWRCEAYVITSSITHHHLSHSPRFIIRLAFARNMDKLRVAKVDNVGLSRLFRPLDAAADAVPSLQQLTGTLHLTPHHLIFSPTSTSASPSEIWIAYPTITLMTRVPQSLRGHYPVQIRTRLFDHYTLSFDRDRDADDVWQSVKDCAVVCKSERSATSRGEA